MSGDESVNKVELDGIEWTYVVKDGFAVVGGASSPAIPGTTSGEIAIPLILGGCPVTKIGDGAFRFCDKLTDVMIPDSVTDIGERAFLSCKGLTHVIISDGVASIGDSAFSHCMALSNVVIPDSMTRIGNYAFRYCKLTSVTIPRNVVSIGDGAFEFCERLMSLRLSDGLTRIGKSAFYCCKELADVTIPDSVTIIGDGAFKNCEGLKSVKMSAGVTGIGDGVFYVCSNLESVTIPDGVTSIGREAFGCCRNLVKVKMPDGVTSIGEGAFCHCENLVKVAIPRGVTSIGSRAFAECTRLKKVNIPDGVTSIGDSAFRRCSGLESVEIPGSVTSIGHEVFDDTPFLRRQPDGLVVAGRVLFAVKGSCPAEIKIPDGVRHIGGKVFSRCGWLKAVTMPDGVSGIGDGAFSGCDKLQSVVMPASVRDIGKDVFAGCHGLKSLKIVGCETSDEAAAWQKWAREVFVGNKLSSDFCKVTTVEKATGKIDVVARFGTVADENALPSFMQSASARQDEWERTVHVISRDCHALLSEEGLQEEDRRENVSLMLQAAFAIIPDEWQISNECDAAQYFFLFCGCLGIPSLTFSHAQVAFGRREWHESYYLFDFTYGRRAKDALRACESRYCPRTEMPDQTRLLFGVNYNPRKRKIDKPLTASFHSECTRYVPNYAASDSFCSEFAWTLTSRDKCGRGDDVVPKDAQDVALWLRQRRKNKEQREGQRSREHEEMMAPYAEDERIHKGEGYESESERLERIRRANIEAFREREKYRTREIIFGAEGEDPSLFIKTICWGVVILVFFMIKSCVQ